MTSLELTIAKALLGPILGSGAKKARDLVLGPADERALLGLTRRALKRAIDTYPDTAGWSQDERSHLQTVLERAVSEMDGSELLRLDDEPGRSAAEVLTGLLRRSPHYDLETLGVDVTAIIDLFLQDLRKQVEDAARRHDSPLFEYVTQENLAAIRGMLTQLLERLDSDDIRRLSRIALGRPAQLPAPPPQGVVGRNEGVVTIVELLELSEPPTHVPPVSVHGLGGIGKTTLVAEVGRALLDAGHFPDGVLWTSLGPRPSLRPLLESWGRALGIDLLGERDIAECTGLLQAVLSASRVLLVIDDVWEQAHARPFLVGGSGCRTLVTTRETAVAYDLSTTSRAHRLDVLSALAALELLARLAPDVVRLHETAARRLCQRMEFLPLGLTLAGRLLAVESDVPDRVEYLLGELNERRQARLAMLQHEGRLGIDDSSVSLQAILGLSVERLDVVDRERFAMLSVLGGDPLTWDLDQAAAVWACGREDAAATVSQLIQHGIVERRGQDYWMHALLADYAAELLDEYAG